MRTLQTELARLKLTKEAKKKSKQPRVRDAKSWYSSHDWSEVEAELLQSQSKRKRSRR